MHLFWANIAPLFLSLLLGKTAGWEDAEWVVSDEAKEIISAELEALGIDLPSLWGNRPRGLNKSRKWKCKEYSTFTLHFSVNLLRPHVSQPIIEMWIKFVKVAELCTQSSITRAEVEQVRVLSRGFVQDWDRIFYGNVDRNRAALSRMCIHYMLHLAEQILDWGPLVGYSQYTAERMIGQLKSCIRARALFLENLQEQVLLRQNDAILESKNPSPIVVKPISAALAISLPDGLWTLRQKRSKRAETLTPQERQAFWTLTGRAGEVDLPEGYGGHRWARAIGPRGVILRTLWTESAVARHKLRTASKCEIEVIDGPNVFIAITSFQQLRDEGEVRLVVFGITHSRVANTLPGVNGTFEPLGRGPGSVLGCWDIHSISRQVLTYTLNRDGEAVLFISAKPPALESLEEGGV
ncbi:hypothetical protein P7C70_g8033, partial [Phenoliferia sp. Uapishka_3]